MSDPTQRLGRRRVSLGLPAAAVAALAALLAACGSPAATNANSQTVTTGSSQTSPTLDTRPPATSAPPSTTAGPTTSSTVALLPPCSSGALSAAQNLADSSNGAGSTELAVALTNGGSTACSLDGFPSVALLGTTGASGASTATGAGGSTSTSIASATTGPSGGTGPTASAPGAGGPLGLGVTDEGPASRVVNLAPKQAAGFYLQYSTVPVDGIGCQQVSSVQVIPPGGSGALSLQASFSACGRSVGVYAVRPLADLAH